MNASRGTAISWLGVFVALASCPFAIAITIPTVPIGNAGNQANLFFEPCPGGLCSVGIGSVSYNYQIGKYEVTNAQYVEFLNSADPSGANPLALYNGSMTTNANGGINFANGALNGAKYSVKAGHGSNAVVFVS